MRTAQQERAGGRRHRAIAREHRPGYDTSGDGAVTDGAPPDELAAAVDGLVGTDLDPRSDGDLRRLLGRTQQAIDRLVAFRTKAAGRLESRALRAAGPGRENRALRDVRDELADELRLTPSQVKQAGETGRRIAQHPAARAAMDRGELPAEHARLLADTLRWLEDPATRADAEAHLLHAARSEDARTFGRRCRRLLAETDTDAAQTAQDRRNARRHLRVTDTPDGMVALHGQGSGLAGEIVQTALHAFRRHDGLGEHRTPEQARWDALVQVCSTALDAGDAPANRGVRPHVLVTVPEPTVADRAGNGGSDRRDHDGCGPGAAAGSDADRNHEDGSDGRGDDGFGDGGGVAEAAWSGPLPWPEVRRILSDCDVSRILVDAAGLPLEAGEAVRTVPAGLWKALQIRDATCIADGCTVPAAWCQVMHLDVPYRLHGRLSLDTAAPGCSHHHRLLDRHGWQIIWYAGRPILHHPERPPRVNSIRDGPTRDGHDTSPEAPCRDGPGP